MRKANRCTPIPNLVCAHVALLGDDSIRRWLPNRSGPALDGLPLQSHNAPALANASAWDWRPGKKADNRHLAVFFRPRAGHVLLWAGRQGLSRESAGPSSGTPTLPVPPTRLASGAVFNRKKEH